MRPLSAFVSLSLAAVLLAAVPSAAAQQPIDPTCDIVGTEGDDVLTGTDADDKICGLGGNDIIRGGRGNDIILGGPGADRLIGGAGRDLLKGGQGDDQIFGQTGRDRVVGNQGSDILDGGGGRDRLVGGAGDDECRDATAGTRRRGCEREGEPKDFDNARALWESSEVGEFVYSVSESPFCETGVICPAVLSAFAVVRVDAEGEATTSVPLITPRNAEDLFAAARSAIDRGGKVRYDPEVGLPVRIDEAGSRSIVIDEIQVRDEIRAQADRARAQWTAAGLDDYEYTFRRICFCVGFGDVRVVVRDGEVVAVLPGDTAEPPDVPSAMTIEGHFEALFRLLDGHHISVNASFDDELGYPTSYGFDTSRLIADEELVTEVFDFTVDGAERNRGLRVVTVAGIEVSETIASQVQALVDKAAADGFTLSGGGFRDPSRQIALRRANCGTSDYAIYEMPASECSPPTAQPGRSMHEKALAIDFTNDGKLITSRSDPAYLWLAANAEDFGLFNHPFEPWHWSTNGN